MIRILIIDDDEIVCSGIKTVLEKEGYEVMVENRGSKGLVATRKFKPDLIFLDVLIPDMEGSEIACQLKNNKDTKEIPVVFLTAVATKTETGQHAGIIGGYPFIAKPASKEELITFIEKNIRK